MRLKAKSGLVLAIAVVLLWSVWQSQSLRARRPREYLPPRETGWIKPNVYKRGDKVDLTVNKVESEITNLRTDTMTFASCVRPRRPRSHCISRLMR